MKNNKRETVVILGGGLAGLSAGYELSRSGKKVIVVEKWDDVGGLARTIKVKNFKFDTGPHRWYTKNDMVNNWMLKLLGNETIQVPRLTRIYFDKKFFLYPIKIGNAMKGMGLTKSIKSLLDYFIVRISQKFHKKKPVTLEDGYISQFGKTLYETFFKRYSEKLWGEKCSQISADWIGQRSRGFNITTVLKESLLGKSKTVSFVDEFSYPKDGIGRIAYRLADGIKSSGGQILLNSSVVGINSDGDKIISVEIKQNGGNRIIKGDHFITSIGLNDFIDMTIPKVPSDISKTANKLKFRDQVQVALFIKKEKITPDTWIYVHPFELPFMRLMEMDNWSSTLSPKGTTSLVFEISCNQGDQVWKKSDKELISWVSDTYIKEFHLIEKHDIIGGFVHRVEKEYPVYHLGYKSDVNMLLDYLNKFTNLQSIGRNGVFRYNNMDHSIEMGLYAAWNIITGSREYNIGSVNIEREYLEEKKIESPEDEKVEKTS